MKMVKKRMEKRTVLNQNPLTDSNNQPTYTRVGNDQIGDECIDSDLDCEEEIATLIELNPWRGRIVLGFRENFSWMV